MEPTHPFNQDSATTGYYTNIDPIDPALALTAAASWTDETSSNAVTDDSGNSYRYIIQRMCRTAEQLPRTDNCLFSAAATNNNGMSVPLPSEICNGPGCPQGGTISVVPRHRTRRRSQEHRQLHSIHRSLIQ